MKLFITPAYTFTPGASGVGTVNLSGISGFNIKNLVSIINQTKGVVIYATATTALRYTALSSTTLTLFLDTSTMSSGDVLQVIYDDAAASIPVSRTALAASYQEITNLTTVQTVTPPAGAKWVKVYADNANTSNIRLKLSGTATSSSGISFEPGRSEDFEVVGSGISVVSESGTTAINFHFGV